jgi:hypothetical protein
MRQARHSVYGSASDTDVIKPHHSDDRDRLRRKRLGIRARISAAMSACDFFRKARVAS